jgi:hypothetical protein
MNVFELKSEKILAIQYYGNREFSDYPDWLLHALENRKIYINTNFLMVTLILEGAAGENTIIHKFDWLVPGEKGILVLSNELFKQLFKQTSL